jgi:ATP-dependent 26S proteasome regulatory subunit
MSTDTDIAAFETLLPAGRESSAHLEARLALMRERRKGSGDESTALDRFLLERYARLTSQLDEVRTIQAKLRKELEKVMAPPWMLGVFIRLVDTATGQLAEVFHGSGRRLVHVGEDVNINALVAGHVVYLGHELNALIGIAPPGLMEVGEIATVERVLDDGRLALRDRDVQILVHAADALQAANIDVGDAVRWSRELMLALEPVQVGAPDELFITEYLSAQAPQSLGGLASQTEQVVSMFTQAIAQPELAMRYGLDHGNTLLLVGPPGTGKTSLARIVGSAFAAATGEQCRFASVKGAQLESPWVGTTQQNVRELFRELKRDQHPTLLFIDEVDAIGRIRGGAVQHHSDKFLSAWLTEIDGLERSHPFGIIASTNRKDLLDQALLERLSGMELFIGRPTLEAAREIFAIHLQPTLLYGPNGAGTERTREEIVDTATATLYSPNADNAVAELRFRDGTARTVTAREILSGRTIEQICVQARRFAFRRHAESGTPGVRVEDMEQAVAQVLERLGSTLSPANARSYLGDLPQDLDVVAVEPVRRKVARHRYLHRADP